MARITEQAAILLTKDMPAALAYWENALGFEVTGRWGEPVGFAILKRDSARLMIGAASLHHIIVPHEKARPGLWDAYFWIDDARSAFDEIKARGAEIDYELCRQDYHVLEFAVRDRDGHVIGFGEVLDESSG